MCAHVSNYNDRDTRDRWRHGKSESAPSLTKVFRRRTSHLNFFAKITSAPMSFRFCADGVPVLGTVWIPAAQSKRRSSAGACVDGNWTRTLGCCVGGIMTFDYCSPAELFTAKRKGGSRQRLGY